MKKIIYLLPLLFLTNCGEKKKIQYQDQKIRCIVTSVLSEPKYGGLIPEKKYTLLTNCGMSFRLSYCYYQVGDTIDVIVRKVK